MYVCLFVSGDSNNVAKVTLQLGLSTADGGRMIDPPKTGWVE